MLNKHNFHLVTNSPWPFLISVVALLVPINFVLFFYKYSFSYFLLIFAILSLIFFMFIWWRDVIREGTFLGNHTLIVQYGLRLGMFLFIISEIMFFFAFFWTFFHYGFGQIIELGCCWPPKFIPDVLWQNFSPWGIPLLNTLILLLSGATLTWAHYVLLDDSKEFDAEEFVDLLINDLMEWPRIRRTKAIRDLNEILFALDYTIFLGILFTFLQIYEYSLFSFDISDSVWGSIFYMATGFHGFHVIIGTLFIFFMEYRIFLYQVSPKHHFGFEAAIWYWHFVDVVWLFLFVSVYCWGTGNLL